MDSSNISFTALYTGHVWYENGMSAPFFTSALGRVMYHSMRPAEMFASQFVGANLKQLLLQRHTIMDHRIEQLIQEEGVTQILEIACGLSPRGYKFSRNYPGIHYVEADLPGMAKRKKNLLQKEQALSNQHEVVSCNFFESGAPNGLDYVLHEKLDPTQPTIIITEGLVNYFPLDTIETVWKKISTLAKVFPKAWYMTDLIPKFENSPSYKYIRAGKWALGTVASADVSLHYTSDQAIEQGFKNCGFSEVTVHIPEDYYQKLPIPKSKAPTFIRVVEAKV